MTIDWPMRDEHTWLANLEQVAKAAGDARFTLQRGGCPVGLGELLHDVEVMLWYSRFYGEGLVADVARYRWVGL